MCNCPPRRGNAACACPPAAIQLKDSAGANVGAVVSLPFGGIANLTLPAGGGGVPTLPNVVDLFTPAAACAVVPATGFLLAEDGVSYDVNSVVQTARRKRLTVAPLTANGPAATTVADVFTVTGGTAFTLTTPGPCDPTDLWIKNKSAALITITAAVGTIDGAATFTIPAAGGSGSGPNAQPTMHAVYDGTNWQVI
jgi:hypothetical protein